MKSQILLTLCKTRTFHCPFIYWDTPRFGNLTHEMTSLCPSHSSNSMYVPKPCFLFSKMPGSGFSLCSRIALILCSFSFTRHMPPWLGDISAFWFPESSCAPQTPSSSPEQPLYCPSEGSSTAGSHALSWPWATSAQLSFPRCWLSSPCVTYLSK